MRPLLERAGRGDIDPGFVVAHRKRLHVAPDGCGMFLDKEDERVKVVPRP
jgi:hypothetical protein